MTSGAVTLSWIHGDGLAMRAMRGIVGSKAGREESRY